MGDLMKKTVSQINYLFYFLIIIVIIFSTLLFQQKVYAQNVLPETELDGIKEINSGWMYKIGDSPFNSVGEPLWSTKYTLSDWKSFKTPGKPENDQNSKRVWLSVKLPIGDWKDPCLFFNTYEQDIEVYLDNKIIYNYGDMHSNENFNRPGTPLSIISLPDNFQNKNIFIRLRSTKNIYTGLVVGLEIGSKSDIILKIFYTDFGKIIFSFLFIFIGLISILVFILRRVDQKAFLSIGIASILVSLWIISETQIKLLFFNNPKLWFYLIHTSNYLICVGFISYIEQVFSRGRLKVILHWLWQFQIFFAFSALVLDLFGITSLTTFINIYFVLLVFYISISIFTVAYESSKGNYEVKIFFAGTIVLSLFAINDFLSIYYRILPWSLSLMHYGMLIFILSLLFILGIRFVKTYGKLQVYSNEIEAKNKILNQMWKEIKNSRDTLAQWNENLEDNVIQKTSAIKNILDNAGQGFLTFSDNLLINDEYSIECEKIFGQEIYRKKFSNLIFAEGEERDYLEKMLIKILNETKEYKKNIYLPLLPEEKIINGKYIKLDYKIIDKSQTNDNTIIMVILTDITDKRFLESKMEAESKVLKMVVKSVTNYNDFIKFIRDYEYFCKTKMYEILNSGSSIQNIVFELFRTIHTFKGSFSQMDMVNVVKKLHDFETKLSEINRNVMNITLEDFKLFLTNFKVSDWLKEDMNILNEVLGEEYFIYDKALTIDQTKLIAIENKLSSILLPEQLNVVLPQLRQLHYKPFKELLINYQHLINKLSERLEKPMNPIKFKGEDVYVNYEKYYDFSISLVHVFRNIMDHGIEELEERISSGKSEVGNITCTIEAKDRDISLVISDDGKGIDIKKIKEVAINKNIFDKTTIEKLSESEVLSLILMDGFSTKNSVTDISGRGIGLAAVKSEVEKLKGCVNIKTEFGLGTEFHFLIPILN